MSTRKRLNVLVCQDAGASARCVSHCIYTLRRLLSPRYSVVPVPAAALLAEPWQDSCALLVFPGGADLGYCRALDGAGTARVRAYLADGAGGAVLGFCAGGYYGAAACEFEVGKSREGLEVVGPRELALFPGVCRGAAFAGFGYDSERGARAALLVPTGAADVSAGEVQPPFRVYYNGGGVFVDAHLKEGVEVLATYGEGVDVDAGQGLELGKAGAAAVVYCTVNGPTPQALAGRVVLSGVHPEFAAANLDRQETVPGYDQLIAAIERDEPERVRFLIGCLKKLGLTPNPVQTTVPLLTPIHLSSASPDALEEVMKRLSVVLRDDTSEKPDCTAPDGCSLQFLGRLRARTDTFVLHRLVRDKEKKSDEEAVAAALESLTMESSEAQRSAAAVDYAAIPKHVIVHESVPTLSDTPHFDHQLYYDSLRKAYEDAREAYPGLVSGTVGQTFLYGETVTSTLVLLEQNPSFTDTLPHGLTFIGTNQVAGRGRGSNPWVSTAGNLLQTVVLQVPLPKVGDASAPSVVFVQYLAAMGIMRAIHGFGKLNKLKVLERVVKFDSLAEGAEEPSDDSDSDLDLDGRPDAGGEKEEPPLAVAIKWPNDIYARTSAEEPWVKIGGILVQSSYSPATSRLSAVIGFGVNVGAPIKGPKDAQTSGLPRSPTTTLNELIAGTSRKPFVLEELAARISAGIEAAVNQFEKKGWKGDLEREYVNSWLHSNQLVAISHAVVEPAKSKATQGPSESFHARILGLTPDWGELLVEEEEIDTSDHAAVALARELSAAGYRSEHAKAKGKRSWNGVAQTVKVGRPTGRFWRLQPDSNSFNFFSGLVRKRM